MVYFPCRVFSVANQQLGGAGRHRERHAHLGGPSPVHLEKRRHVGNRLVAIRRRQGTPQHGAVARDSHLSFSSRGCRKVRSVQHNGKHLEPDVRKRHRSRGQWCLPLGLPAETRSRHGLACGSVDVVLSLVFNCRANVAYISVHINSDFPQNCMHGSLISVYWQYF